MGKIVLGIGTSHSPMLSTPGEMWEEYGRRDSNNGELVFPPDGVAMPYEKALASYVPKEVQARFGNEASFKDQYDRAQAAIGQLQESLASAKPDITVILSDDQDEWFFENNMPTFSVYWGSSVRVIPHKVADDAPEFVKIFEKGYGDIELDVPVPSDFGRHVIDHLMDHDFDVAHMAYADEMHGGKVARRYPTPDGELDLVRETAPRPAGLPHGYSFVVKRLFENNPTPILPVFLNTCYPPNQVRPARAYDFGKAIAAAISTWDKNARVAVIGSGGLSHFVVDEEIDRTVLDALQKGDEETLRNLPRHRLFSATSEILNWVATGGALADAGLEAEVLDYLPVYRTPAGTGGGWGFMRWQ